MSKYSFQFVTFQLILQFKKPLFESFQFVFRNRSPSYNSAQNEYQKSLFALGYSNLDKNFSLLIRSQFLEILKLHNAQY